jgi:LuxR family transcriptional regulator
MEVLNHLADGMTSIEISRLLMISNHTVDWYMNSIQDKLKARNRQHIVAIAFRNGLIP